MKDAYILRITCPDAPGIVASVAQFIYERSGNILRADEHVDTESATLLMRVSIEGLSKGELEKYRTEFVTIAKKFNMQWDIDALASNARVAICTSKENHCLSDLLTRFDEGEMNGQVACIISNHPDHAKIAAFYGIPFSHISGEKSEMEKSMLEILQKHSVETIILARYMQILSKAFVERFPMQIINIHHSFLPAFIGAKPYHQAHERGVKIIGATAHYVTHDLDGGPIIEQDIEHVSHRESVTDLVQKGRDIEKIVLSRAVKWHLEKRILTFGNKTVVFD